MKRHLRAAFLIGLATTLLVSLLHYAGAFAGVDLSLRGFFGLASQGGGGEPYQYAVVAFLAFGMAWTTVDISRALLKTVIAAAVFLQVGAMLYVLSLYGVYFSPVPGMLAVLLAFVAGAFYARTDAGKRKRVLGSIFENRLSVPQFRRLVDSDVPLEMNGELREASVLVCRIFNHDDLMEVLEAGQYVSMVNAWLKSSADFLLEQGAYIEECDGDGIRCIFGSPLPGDDHAVVAVRAAMELDLRLRNLNLECDGNWHQTLDYRIGVNSGPMIAAAYGSEALNGFGVAGETVDFCRRLSRESLEYGVRILAGPDTYQAVEQSVISRPVDILVGHGQSGVVEIYEPLALAEGVEESLLERVQAYWEGLIYFREGRHREAGAKFNEADPEGMDPLVAYYQERLDGSRGETVPRREVGSEGELAERT